MKKKGILPSLLLALCLMFAAALPAAAETGDDLLIAPAPQALEIYVTQEKTPLDLSALPSAPFYDGDVLMVPLRAVAEALGYRVGWDAETGAITVDDDYIQYAVLKNGSATAVFTGRLKVIDMSREVENAAETVILDGRTYIPAAFFTEFFNDVTLAEEGLFIAPGMAELERPPALDKFCAE